MKSTVSHQVHSCFNSSTVQVTQHCSCVSVYQIISRRKTLAEIKAEYDQDLHPPQPTCDQATSSHENPDPDLWVKKKKKHVLFVIFVVNCLVREQNVIRKYFNSEQLDMYI